MRKLGQQFFWAVERVFYEIRSVSSFIIGVHAKRVVPFIIVIIACRYLDSLPPLLFVECLFYYSFTPVISGHPFGTTLW